MWTLFWDMHSGGGTKEEPYEKIYIEAPEDEARVVFYCRFGHNPARVTCTCCAEDYSVYEEATLEQATGFHRNCAWDDATGQYIEQQDTRWRSSGRYLPLDEYLMQPDVLVIRADEIKEDERYGEVPQQGYVWMEG